jgi:hypothetical protein
MAMGLDDDGFGVWRIVMLGAATAVGLLGLAYAQSEREKARKNMQRLASVLGLRVAAPRLAATSLASNRMTGIHGGRTVDVYTRVEDHDKERDKRAVIAMIVRNPRRLSVRMGGGFLAGLATGVAGEKRVLTGDGEFDGTVQVYSNAPAYLGVALLPEIRQRIVRAWQLDLRGIVTVAIGEIRYEEKGAFEDAKAIPRIRAIMEMFGDLADIVELYPG